MPMPTADIVVAAVALVRDECVLTVRKRGTERFMLVGGKLEPGESPRDAALRETYEEVGLAIESATLLGEFVSEAAEVRWTPLRDHPDDLAPMLEHHVLPVILAAATNG